MSLDPAAAAVKPEARLAGLDLARGVAIAAMVVYHFAWDLSFLGLIETEIREVSAWTWFARAIAASFLAIVGVSLVLAHQRGFRAEAFLKRLALIAGAALLVTAATWYLFPRSFVFFGILHAIALGSVLALPFLRWPAVVAALAGVFVLILPQLIRLDALSAPLLVWLGLGARVPVTNDFVPVFPWFAFVLFGLALAKAVDLRRLLDVRAERRPLRLLAWAGRNSLVIYLLHQPILFGALSLLASALTPPIPADARGFLSACHAQCRSVAGDPAICTGLCTCAMRDLRAEGLWANVLADNLDASMRARVDAITQRCAKEVAPSEAPR